MRYSTKFIFGVLIFLLSTGAGCGQKSSFDQLAAQAAQEASENEGGGGNGAGRGQMGTCQGDKVVICNISGKNGKNEQTLCINKDDLADHGLDLTKPNQAGPDGDHFGAC